MNADFDIKTSTTLLEKMRVYEDRAAWSRFLRLYRPMIEAWARRFGLSHDDVDELTSRLLSKLVQALPRFEYDSKKGTFRGWLKTVTQRELVTFARERRRRSDKGTGKSTVYDLLLEQPDGVDDLVTGLHDTSAAMLRGLQQAMKEVEAACKGAEEKSWEVFRRIFLTGEKIEAVSAEVGSTYHATAMRVQRIKKKVRSRALELAMGGSTSAPAAYAAGARGKAGR
jgi:RNA polymerase sigma-70 factor (ECF subfamily)